MSVTRRETVVPGPAEQYRGTFAVTEPVRAVGDALPPGWEGVYFPFAAALADLRADGTPARDGVLPEIDLPRRMYAGEDTEFRHPIVLGDPVVQTTTLGETVEKTGAAGRLVFVDLVREYAVGGEVAVRSVWHDVFLGAAPKPAPDVPDPNVPARPPRRDPDAATAADWVDEVVLDARQLFRFSALTFNTHLIHYDRAWARDVEGLPDLLVHGPLLRILLLDAARRHHPDARAQALSVRMSAPTLVDRPVRLAGTSDGAQTRIVALDADEVVLATATVMWHPLAQEGTS